MAKGTLTEPRYVAQLSSALRHELRGADVAYEPIRRDRYRFVVIWKAFEGVGHPERQRRVWDIADQTVNKADLLRVGMIVTLAPSEVP